MNQNIRRSKVYPVWQVPAFIIFYHKGLAINGLTGNQKTEKVKSGYL